MTEKEQQAGSPTGRIAKEEPRIQNIPLNTEEGKAIREAFAPSPTPKEKTMAMDKEREALVRKILLGIDETECESEHGWWETSSGAEFGKKKLEELIAALTAQQEPSGVREGMLRAERDAYKKAYEYLQGRMESLDRHGWAHDADGDIEYAITRAAEQVTAEGHACIPVYLDQCAPSAPTPSLPKGDG